MAQNQPERLRDHVMAQIGLYQRRLASIDSLGEDTYRVGTVITCEYKDYGITSNYEHVAMAKQSDNYWTSTRSGNGRFDWDAILEFLLGYEGVEINNIRVILSTDGKPLRA